MIATSAARCASFNRGGCHGAGIANKIADNCIPNPSSDRAAFVGKGKWKWSVA
jgi:hypothetical protein